MSRTGESHVRIVVSFPDDPKVRALARFGEDAGLARDLYVQMCLFCKRTQSDGLVPEYEVSVLAYPLEPERGLEIAGHLAAVGLVEKTSSGAFRVVAYVRRNGSRADAERLSRKRAVAGARGGKAKQVAKQVAKQSAKQVATAAKQVATPPPLTSENTAPEAKQIAKQVAKQIATDDSPGTPPTPAQRCKTITDQFYTDVRGMCNWNAINAIVRKAITAGHTDDAITAALSRLAGSKRPITAETLRVEIEGRRPAARRPALAPASLSPWDN